MSTLQECVRGDFPWLEPLVGHEFKIGEAPPVIINPTIPVGVIKPELRELQVTSEGVWECSQYAAERKRDRPSCPDVKNFRFFWIVIAPEGAKQPILLGPLQPRAFALNPRWIAVESIAGLIVRGLAEELQKEAKQIILSGKVGCLRLEDITHLIPASFYLKAELMGDGMRYSWLEGKKPPVSLTVAKIEPKVAEKLSWDSSVAWRYYPTDVNLF